MGLPTHRAIGRKPGSECEIKTSACGRIGIMLQMQIVKSDKSEEKRDTNEFVTHSASITRQLVEPWKNTNRIVGRDACIASVNTFKQMYDIGLRFIGVVKTAHRHFSAQYLGSVTMEGRGNSFQWFITVQMEIETLVHCYAWTKKDLTLLPLRGLFYLISTFIVKGGERSEIC